MPVVQGLGGLGMPVLSTLRLLMSCTHQSLMGGVHMETYWPLSRQTPGGEPLAGLSGVLALNAKKYGQLGNSAFSHGIHVRLGSASHALTVSVLAASTGVGTARTREAVRPRIAALLQRIGLTPINRGTRGVTSPDTDPPGRETRLILFGLGGNGSKANPSRGMNSNEVHRRLVTRPNGSSGWKADISLNARKAKDGRKQTFCFGT